MTFEAYTRGYFQRLNTVTKDEINYRDGCLMSAAQYLYEVTGDSFYLNAILSFGSRHVSKQGELRGFVPGEHNVDKLRFGLALFFLHKQTGEERYKLAMDTLIANLIQHPRTTDGCFWHKDIYPYQVWLDGLYMAMPFYLTYENEFGGEQSRKDTLHEFAKVREKMFCQNSGLYYHAWDEKAQQPWADPRTGLSPNFWLRGIGWFLMALVDCYELIPGWEAGRLLRGLLREAVEGLLPYREKSSGLFYQLVALPHEKGNYLETSGSAMVSYALFKGTRLGMLEGGVYPKIAEEILVSLQANMLPWKEGGLSLQNICGAAGLGPGDVRDGSAEYYLSEPIVPDSPLGAAALMMAHSEWLRAEDTAQEAINLVFSPIGGD